MTLSEKSRSAIYQGLASVVEDEEAIEEMLSHFPGREVEEPVTKDFLRAELADLRAELLTELHDANRRSIQWMVTVSVAGWAVIVGATAAMV